MMNQLSKSSYNQGQNFSACTATAVVSDSATADYDNVSGRTVRPVSGKPLGVNRADPLTGQKDQKEVGISSRAVALDVDTCEVAACESGLRKRHAIQHANTAILSDRQVKLIQELIDGRNDRLTEDEFIDVADFLPCD
ncbi:hypothetical protein, partial [Endozoicomonas sp. SESOKO2]